MLHRQKHSSAIALIALALGTFAISASAQQVNTAQLTAFQGADGQHFSFSSFVTYSTPQLGAGCVASLSDIRYNGSFSNQSINQVFGQPEGTAGVPYCSTETIILLSGAGETFYAPGTLTGYALGNSLNWAYIDLSGTVWVSTLNNGSWSNPLALTGLNGKSGAAGVCVAAEHNNGPSGLASFLDSGGNPHIVYVTAAGHVDQLVYSLASKSWGCGDLTLASGAPTVSGPNVAGFATSGDQHWIFQGTNNHVYQIVYTQSTGKFGVGDITGATVGATTPEQQTPLSAFLDPSNGQHFVFEAGNNIYEIVYNGRFSQINVSAQVNAPAAAALATFDAAGYQHFAFVNLASSHVFQIVYSESTGGWGLGDISAAAGDPNLP